MPWKKLEGPGIGVVLGITVFLLLHLGLDRPIVPGARRAYEPIQQQTVELDGGRLYAANCAACHQATGLGLPGTFPPLAESAWVTGDPETPIRIILLGLTGPIEVNGQTYNGVMPAQGQLNDEQIAAVATFIRSSFGNDAPVVEASVVAEVRASLGGRTESWNGGEELDQARQRP